MIDQTTKTLTCLALALATSIVGLISTTVPASAQVATYTLGQTLCQDAAGVNPNYTTHLPVAPAGSPRPLLRRTLTGPDSRCNDGSPAVMYIRPAAAASPNRDKWIVFIDGGGGCGDEDACLERFCSLSGDWIDVAGKMSSLGAPAALDPPQGILSRQAANRFNNWNHVLVHYCSSDDWVGSAAEKQLIPPSYAGRDYSIQFNGEAIVSDVFDTLTAGPTVPDNGNQEYALPDLRSGLLLFAGESAAASGERFHVDRIAARLAVEGVTVKGVTDAGFSPSLSDPTLPWDVALSGYSSYDDLGANYNRPRFRDFWEVDDSALDETCLLSGVLDYYCMDSIYTVLNEISTPSFVHADLVDSMGDKRLVDWGTFPSRYEIAAATRDQFALLPAGFGWFGQQCHDHVQIQRGQFTRTTILGGSGQTFNDTLFNWVRGVGVTTDVQSDANGFAPYDRSLLCN